MERSIVARSINILCSKISLNDSTYKRIHPRIIGGKFGVNCASPEGDLCGGREEEVVAMLSLYASTEMPRILIYRERDFVGRAL